MFLAKEKALYMSLNMMKQQNQSFLGYFWAPAEYETKIRTAMSNQTATKISLISDNYHISPPTFFKANEVTMVF